MTGARAALVVLPACGPTPGSDAPVPPDVVDADGDGVPAGEDCADGDADIRPGADERCNGLDDDCDGEIDEDAVDADPWFPDRDGDGFGAEDGEILACTRPDGTLDIAGDCDDTTATVNPDRPESCNGRDDDCDGEVDEPGAAGEQTWFQDADGDGFGDPESAIVSCAGPSGHVLDDTDCDDSSPAVFPGAEEQCATGRLENCSLEPTTVFELCGPGGVESVSGAALVLEGSSAGDRVGDRIAAAGDIDGDGADDLLMSSPDAGPGGTGAGAVWLIPGTANGINEVDAASSAVLIGAEGMGLGAALLTPGDLDGDGQDDIIVGATAGGNGEIIAMLGPISGSIEAEEARWATWAAPTEAEAGSALVAGGFGAAAGLAIAVGAPGGALRGVFLVTPPSAGGGDLETQAHLSADREGSEAGVTLSSAGDVNGDGIEDLIIGAPADDRITQNGGVAFLFRGPVTADASLEDAHALFRGSRTGAAFGGGLTGAGDLDDDGFDDVVIGAYADDTVATSSGAAYVFSGPVSGGVSVGSARASIYGTYRGDGLGRELVGSGDLDGDGIPDLLLGSSSADLAGTTSGAVFAFLGPVTGTRTAESAASIQTGVASGSRLGSSVALVPDRTGDGTSEMLLGAPTMSPGGRTTAGAVYLVPGGGR